MKNPNTIQIIAKEWRDKINANSYFSVRCFFDNVLVLTLPFQYGYGDQFECETFYELIKQKMIKENDNIDSGSLWRWCEKHKVNKLCFKAENCKKSKVKSWGLL